MATQCRPPRRLILCRASNSGLYAGGRRVEEPQTVSAPLGIAVCGFSFSSSAANPTNFSKTSDTGPCCSHSIKEWHEEDPPGGDLAICDFPGCLCPVTEEKLCIEEEQG